MKASRVRRELYRGARLLGDYQAVKRGRILERLLNKLLGRIVGKVWR